jgi:hypothetical protein
MTNDVQKIDGGPLNLTLDSLDASKLVSLKIQHLGVKRRALEAGYANDRKRVLDALSPDNVEKNILETMAAGKSSFVVDLGKGSPRSDFWKPEGATSRKILRELNRELRSNTVLTKAKYVLNDKHDLPISEAAINTARRLGRFCGSLHDGWIWNIFWHI